MGVWVPVECCLDPLPWVPGAPPGGGPGPNYWDQRWLCTFGFRIEIDVKIVIKNDAKTKRAGQFWAEDIGSEPPPQGPPGRRPRDPGEAAQAPWDL